MINDTDVPNIQMPVVSDAICVYSPSLDHVAMTSCLTLLHHSRLHLLTVIQ